MKKITLLLIVITSYMSYGQEYVNVKTSIPSNNANNAQGEKNAIWRNSVKAPTTTDNFPNQQNWWSILQTQFHDTRYDAQLAFGLNKQDLWLRFNYNDTWKPWRKIIVEDDNGHVGIGTTSPISLLHVATNEDAVSWSMILNNQRNSSTISGYGVGLKLKHSFNNENKWSGIASIQESTWANSSGLALYSNESEKMRIRADGNVGIGTTEPKSKLSVNGNIRATEVKVMTDITVPDYVFEEDYALRSLEETEVFISENKHLPEIPSAADIGDNGLDLGEMNMKLLQKIEELTLYLIEQNKKLEKANKNIEALQQEVAAMKSQ